MDRLEILAGRDALKKISEAKILIVGIGGVGSHVCEALIRNGFKNLTLIDSDKVELSNFNRHVIGFKKFLGMPKTTAMELFLKEIYDDLSIKTINEKFSYKTISILSDNYDFVVDAIDKLSDKIELIIQCYNKKIKIVSSMGAGGKITPMNIRLSDISVAYGDRLLKRVKKNLKKHNIEKGIPVVYCTEQTRYIQTGSSKIIGSCAHIPAIFGNIIAGFIFEYFIKNQ